MNTGDPSGVQVSGGIPVASSVALCSSRSAERLRGRLPHLVHAGVCRRDAARNLAVADRTGDRHAVLMPAGRARRPPWRRLMYGFPRARAIRAEDAGSGSSADGGETGIRTLETVPRLHTFQACAFDHSATSPCGGTKPFPAAARKVRGGTSVWGLRKSRYSPRARCAPRHRSARRRGHDFGDHVSHRQMDGR